MSLHLNLSTGKFLNSSTLFKLSDALLLDVSSGEIVMSNLLVPRAGVDLFKLASLDLNFAQRKSLTDRVSGNNLITFSRASTGTYVDSDGLIKTSPVNLVYPSESIDDGVGLWTTTTNSGTISVTPNFTESPYGTTTATRVVATKSGTGYGIIQVQSNVPSNPSVGSIWIKSNTGSNQTIYFRFDKGGGEDYNLTVTPEWQRYQMIEDEGAGTVFFSVGVRGGSDTSCDVSIWGAQIEEGSTATDYIPTGATKSGAPRFDHDPVTGESLGLLIEEGRTNLMLNSGTTAEMSPVSGVSRTSGGFTAPDNTTDASRVDLPAAATGIVVGALSGLSASPTVYYTASIYLKGVNGGEIVWLTLEQGVPTFSVAANLTTEWQRFDITSQTSNGTLYFNVGVDLRPTAGQTSQPAQSFYAWGAQVEAGSFPTSYIPTDGTPGGITRTPDIATIEGNKFAKTNLLEYSNYSQVNVSSTATLGGTTTAPDGTNTARVYSTSLTSAAINKLYTNGVVGKDYTFSFYVRSTGSTSQVRVFVGDPAVSEFKSISTEWQRISVTKLNNASNIVRAYVNIYAGDEIELWGAQLETGDELTEYTPSVESFVSRASTATYVDDATGLIKTTPVNLAKYSEELSSRTQWVSSSTGSETADATTAPDGSITADYIYGSDPSGGAVYKFQSYILTASSTYTFSVHAKKADTDWITIRAGSFGAPTDCYAWFNVADGTTGSTSGGTPDSTSVVALSDGWYRCSLTVTLGADAIGLFQVFVPRADGSTSYSAGQTVGAYLWGAQLEEGTTATPYIKTTDTISGAARYENGELLLEEARTNLVPNSIVTAANGWTVNNITETLNATTAPDGTLTATEYTLTTTSNPNTRRVFRFFTTSSLADTVTIFVKAGGTDQLFMRGLRNNGIVKINLTSGVVTDNTSVSIVTTTPYANGWWRITLTDSSSNPIVYLSIPNGVPAGGSFYVWGAQLEEATYPTSYIPTDGTPGGITRAADVSTSALGVDTWYNQSEGTVFVDATGEGARVVGINDGTNANRHELFQSGSLLYCYQVRANINEVNLNRTKESKSSFAYKTNDYSFTAGGSSVVTDTSATPPTVDQMNIGCWYNDTSQLNGHISRLAYFPTRKTDQELIDLTT